MARTESSGPCASGSPRSPPAGRSWRSSGSPRACGRPPRATSASPATCLRPIAAPSPWISPTCPGRRGSDPSPPNASGACACTGRSFPSPRPTAPRARSSPTPRACAGSRSPEPAPDGAPSAILAYAEGLRWLTITETRDPRAPAEIGLHAEEVRLSNGVAYYEPASPGHGRRLAIHTDQRDLVLETNLPREELLALAGSLPVEGLTLPEPWLVRETEEGTIERVTLEEAQRAAPFELLLPTELPPGIALASVELVTTGELVGVTCYFQGKEVAIGALRLHLEPGDEVPPTTEPELETVDLDGTPARYSPRVGRLEWIAEGRYVSLEGPGLTLAELVAVARSLAPAPPLPGPSAGTATPGASGPQEVQATP